MDQRCVVAIGYEGVNAFDLMGPVELLATASHKHPDGEPYRIVLAGPDGRPFRSESGLMLVPEVSLDDAPAADTLIVPGGFAIRQDPMNRLVADWLRPRLASTRRVTTVCTGVYALAATGALDGRQATTHWGFIADMRRRFPKVEMLGARIFVKDGKFYTSGGVASGIDMALALVAEDLGARFASSIAEHMVIQSIRGDSQGQVSVAMRAQAQAADRLSGLLAWIGGNLDAPLDVDRLAMRAALSVRQLHRLFVSELGVTPARYVLARRLEAARDLLASGLTVEAAATTTGFASADSFRRAFSRKYGDAPSRVMAGMVG